MNGSKKPKFGAAYLSKVELLPRVLPPPGPLTQLVECHVHSVEVAGSSPAWPTIHVSGLPLSRHSCGSRYLPQCPLAATAEASGEQPKSCGRRDQSPEHGRTASYFSSSSLFKYPRASKSALSPALGAAPPASLDSRSRCFSASAWAVRSSSRARVGSEW